MRGIQITSQTSLVRAMGRLAIPNLAEEFLMLAVGWTDWYLAGHWIGTDASKAAMGLLGYIMWLLPNSFVAVSIGALALIARYVGAGNRSGAELIAKQSLMAGLALAGFLTVACYFLGDSLIGIMQLRGEAAELASSYLALLVPIIPLIMLEKVGTACLHGSGDTVTGFVARCFVATINLLASFSLMTGSFGLPELGWLGLAWGTAIGHSTGALIIAAALVSRRSGLWRGTSGWWIQWPIIRRIFNIGLPAEFDVMALLGGQFVFLAMINSLGTAAAAAHSLAIQIEACAYLPGSAFQVAAATMTGQLLGAGDKARARKAGLVCLFFGGIVICLSGVVIYLFGEQLGVLFVGSNDPGTTQKAGELLRIVAFAMPSLATVMILSGALRGAGDTRLPFVYTMIGLVGVRLPLTLFLSFQFPLAGLFPEFALQGIALGVAGGWYAMLSDLVVRSALFTHRFLGGHWVHRIV